MSPSVARDEIVRHLDEFLDVARIPDSSPNGLQVQGTSTVSRAALAVDVSVQTIELAVHAGAQMLIVHHGLWWGRHEQIVGNMYARVAGLIRNDVSLYAAHLPLDCHPVVGNNAELARRFGLSVECRFAEHKGVELGVIATAPAPVLLDAFADSVEKAIDNRPDVLAFGPKRVTRVGIVSGGGASFVEAAGNAGCDTLVTGESAHSAWHMAREAGINLIFGGHYATETVGLQALMAHVEKKFSISCEFISAPTGY